MRKITFLLLFVSFFGYSQEKKFAFVFLNKKFDKVDLPKEEEDKVMEGHMVNIKRMAKEGKLLAAGPFDGGGGIFVFNSTDQDQVKDWLATDPGVKANRWNLETLLYTPRFGSVCLANEPYEMVGYEFIRYTANITKYNVQRAPEIAKEHDDYLRKLIQTGNVIAEGLFGDDGGILIIKGELDKKVIEADPSLNEGLYQLGYKKLYIAKGAFCEK